MKNNVANSKGVTTPSVSSTGASVSPLKYVVTLGNQFSSVTMYFNGDADASAAADARCG